MDFRSVFSASEYVLTERIVVLWYKKVLLAQTPWGYGVERRA